MVKISSKVIDKKVLVGTVESPKVNTDLPDNAEVGDKLTPQVTVLRADNSTPIKGVKVDFFYSDSFGVATLGYSETDINGIAIAPTSYYIDDAQAGTEIHFLFQIRGKKI